MSENYVMPKVSTIIQESGRLNYGARRVLEVPRVEHRNNFERFFYYMFNVTSLMIMTALFALSLFVTVFMLHATANSPMVTGMQNQEVSSDGYQGTYSIDVPKMVKEIGK